MPEFWELLATARQQRALCGGEVDAIKEACQQKHSRRHIVECAECYGQVLDRMQRRYTSSPDTECFAGQPELHSDLRDLFLQARERKGGLRAVEERITVARQARIRKAIKNSQVIRRLMKDSGHAHVLQKIDDGSAALDSLLSEVGNALGPRPASVQELDGLLNQLTGAAMQSPDDSLDASRKIFFSDSDGIPITASTAEQEKPEGGSSLDHVLQNALERSHASKAFSELKEKHRRRLDELRRAQTAHENQKTRKTRHQQAETGRPQTPPCWAEAPACAVCRASSDSKSFVCCPLCQLRADLSARPLSTAYCSTACYQDGFDSHITEAHGCAAGDDCIQLKAEDGHMDADDSVVLCNDCLASYKSVTSYCSKQCAVVDWQHHSGNAHNRQRDKGHARLEHADGSPDADSAAARWPPDNLVCPLREALVALEKRRSVAIKVLD